MPEEHPGGGNEEERALHFLQYPWLLKSTRWGRAGEKVPLSGLSLYREPFSGPHGSERRFPGPSSNQMELKSGLVSSPES